MEFTAFYQQLFWLSFTVIGVLITGIAGYVAAQLHALSESVNALNKNVAVILEKVSAHESEIGELKETDEKLYSLILQKQ